MSLNGVVAAMTIKEATDGDIFLAFIQQVLCPALKPGDVVVMDNLSSHTFAYPNSDAGRQALEKAIEGLGEDLEDIRTARDAAPPGEDGRQLSRPEARELISRTLSTYFGRILRNSVLMKHEAFSEEREWRVARLAFALSQEIKFRTSTSGIVPYAVIPIADAGDSARIIPGLIKRVVVGPLGNASHDARSRAVSVVSMLLESSGIEVAHNRGGTGAVVEASKLPC
jgi:hypothetical protein